MKRSLKISLFSLLVFGVIYGAKKLVLLKQDDALKFIFPDAEKIEEKIVGPTKEQRKEIEKLSKVKLDKRYDKEFKVYIGKKGGKVIRYGCIEKVRGKWGPIEFIIGVNPDGTIYNLAVMSYRERRGRPVAKRRFLDQFLGKSLKEPLRLKKDIDGVTGATISSKGMTQGVRKTLALFKVLYGVGE